MNRTELEDFLIEKSRTDAAFRRELIDNPRAAIRAVTSVEVPPGVEITVFEETPGRRCLVLPAAVSDELSDADLAGVSGGIQPKPEGRRTSRQIAEDRLNPDSVGSIT